MLNFIELKRFKSICNELPIELEPFSLLCGSNSSGKSSFIQAILFLSQSLSARFERTSFVLNGPLVKLGSITDIKNYKLPDETFEIRFSLDTSQHNWFLEDINNIEVRFVLGKRNGADASLEDELHPVISEAAIRLTIKNKGETYNEFFEISDTPQKGVKKKGQSTAELPYRIDRIYCSEMAKIESEFPGMTLTGCKRDSYLPSNIIFEYDHTKKISSEVINALSEDQEKSTLLGSEIRLKEEITTLPRALILEISRLIRLEHETLKRTIEIPDALAKALKANQKLAASVNLDVIRSQLTTIKILVYPGMFPDDMLKKDYITLLEWRDFVKGLEPKIATGLRNFINRHHSELKDIWYENSTIERRAGTANLKRFQSATEFLTFFFARSIKYLGPLRNEPQAIYPGSGMVDPRSVGLKGENTAAALHINKDRILAYPGIPTAEDGEVTIKKASLMKGCKEWLSYLNVLNDFRTKDTGKLGYELKVKTDASDNEWQDLTHVGVGVSQVLPIVLMALLADEGDILVFEQPELHLHPKVQSRLCDFFIAVASAGRQCIIETHSEYMITRLRSRIAQSKDSKTKDISSIIFINKINGFSNFSKVDISRFGAIEQWPNDFFDESEKETENIIREAAKKRKKEKQEKEQLSRDGREPQGASNTNL
ncbi:DUF3696 domain-containing protein [Ectopseudomonas khazarica]|uniref:DUF3696 domain-containing protein n=1 Tax=Ectopseudomonas khazarica TaxID=2502979 RepID=UPI002FE0B8B6